jgi:hypothetical protein
MDNKIEISKNFICDNRISLKAKGLFLYMLTFGKENTKTLQMLANENKCGIDYVLSGMVELKKFGYVTYLKNKDGTHKYILNIEEYL